MKKYILLLFPIIFYGQSQTENYVKSKIYKIPSDEIISNGDINDVAQSVTFYDGLGYPKQKILNKQSTSGKDIITHIEYDEFGRQKIEFLPYVSNSSTMEIDHNALYSTLNYADYLNQYPYSEKEFDKSPLNLITKQSAPGEDWKMGNGNEIKFEYKLNSANEIINFSVNNGDLVNFGYFKPNLVRKKVVKNENWKQQDNNNNNNNNTIHEFTDNFGNVILKRTFNNNRAHDTYYVYDKVGNLTYVLPPLFFNNFTISSPPVNTCNFNKSIYYGEILRHPGYESGPLPGGGGGATVSVANNTITIHFSGGFLPCILNENSMPLIIAPEQCSLPDMSIGFIKLGTNSYDYFVYIENNRLRIVKKNPWQPIVQITSFNNETITATIDQSSSMSIVDPTLLSNLCYHYKYDEYNRLIEKKIPGKQWEYLVYNKLDQPVASGPAYTPYGGEAIGWLFTKYDAFGRVVYTGWMARENINSNTRNELQIQVDNSTQPLYESKTTSVNTIDDVQVKYTNDAFPSESVELLTVNYYDNYDFPNAPTLPTTIYDETVVTNVKTLPTGSWTRFLTNEDETNGELSYSFYDKKGRPIASATLNHLGGITFSKTKLDFEGKILFTDTEHKRTANDNLLKINDIFEYSSQGKLLTHLQQVASNPQELILHNEYDELGRLISKNVGGQDITSFIGYQKIDYQYNIRGWLKSINDVTDLNSSHGLFGDLFSFKINYNTVTKKNTNTNIIEEVEDSYNQSVKKLYNGNIAETYWRTSSDNTLRKYSYSYDNLNRLNDAYYQKPESNIELRDSYNESLNYDKNGNILTLQRTGNYDGDLFVYRIDELTYTYQENSNLLMKVTDYSNESLGFKDDSDGTNDTEDDYKYDANGNMISDQNKKIVLIEYNHLNLPVSIEFSSSEKIYYFYNALGIKLKKEVHEYLSTNGLTITDYLSGFQYVNEVLQFFPHPEGYVKNTPGRDLNPTFDYVYNYTDHLGNIRLSYTLDPATDVLKILEENHYYPFGLKHTNYSTGKKGIIFEPLLEVKKVLPVLKNLYDYKYNGKEWQDELGLNMYDYHARNYDPAIGRWMNIDPLAENSRRWTPYNYAYNNPIFFVDPDGMQAKWVPSVNGNMIAEKNDNANTLAKQLNISEKKAQSMINSQNLETDSNGNVKTGEKLNLDSNYTQALTKSNSEKGLTTKEILKENLSRGDSYERSNKNTDAYNCTDAAICGTKGVEITPANGDKYGMDELSWNSALEDKSQYTEVSQSEAKFGQTIYSFNNKQGTHAAVYYGTSQNGTIFVFTKNGEYAKPAIMPLSAVQELYGTPSAMYNPVKK